MNEHDRGKTGCNRVMNNYFKKRCCSYKQQAPTQDRNKWADFLLKMYLNLDFNRIDCYTITNTWKYIYFVQLFSLENKSSFYTLSI